MRIHRVLPSLAIVLALTFVFVVPALGATAPAPAPVAASASAASSTPVDASAGGPIGIQVWPGQEGRTAIISAVTVDANVKLPTVVRIPVIPGSSVEWAGEILGGEASGDIKQPFKLVQGRGGQFAEFTLTKSHRGQVDAIVPLTFKGDIASVSIEYVQSVDSTLTSMGARIPANVSKVKISPQPVGSPEKNLEGEMLYTIKSKAFRPGEKLKIEVSFSIAPPVEPAPGSELNPVLIGLAVALGVAVVAMIVIVRRQNPPPAGEDTEYAEEPAYEETYDADVEPDEGSSDDEDVPDLDFK